MPPPATPADPRSATGSDHARVDLGEDLARRGILTGLNPQLALALGHLEHERHSELDRWSHEHLLFAPRLDEPLDVLQQQRAIGLDEARASTQGLIEVRPRH